LKRTEIWLFSWREIEVMTSTPFDAGQRIFERLADLRLDDLGRGAAIGGIDGHHRLVDLRVFANRQAV
jgi:hypothetical protein